MKSSTPLHNLSKQRRYQIRRNKEGNCTICGKPQVKNRTGNLSGYCQKHLELVRKISREYYKRKKCKSKENV